MRTHSHLLDTRVYVDHHWEPRFLRIAKEVASWSKDPSTKCGAVIVRPDKTLCSVGFNGFPKGCYDFEYLYKDRETKYSRVVHAEVNAILHANEPVKGYTMYTWPGGIAPSCDRCTAVIIQSGISLVVHEKDDSEFSQRWEKAAKMSLQMYKEAGVEVLTIG